MIRCAVSCRQETIGEKFPTRLDAIVVHTDRKLFDGRFLDSARNDEAAWHYCVSCRQETVCEGFPIEMIRCAVSCRQETIGEKFPTRLDAIVVHTDRKLFDGRFLDSARNDEAAWHYCVSCRQETVCEGFPIEMIRCAVSCRQETIGEKFPTRLDAIVVHTDRKLFDGRFLDSARNDEAAWHYCVSCRQETVYPKCVLSSFSASFCPLRAAR